MSRSRCPLVSERRFLYVNVGDLGPLRHRRVNDWLANSRVALSRDNEARTSSPSRCRCRPFLSAPLLTTGIGRVVSGWRDSDIASGTFGCGGTALTGRAHWAPTARVSDGAIRTARSKRSGAGGTARIGRAERTRAARYRACEFGHRVESVRVRQERHFPDAPSACPSHVRGRVMRGRSSRSQGALQPGPGRDRRWWRVRCWMSRRRASGLVAVVDGPGAGAVVSSEQVAAGELEVLFLGADVLHGGAGVA